MKSLEYESDDGEDTHGLHFQTTPLSTRTIDDLESDDDDGEEEEEQEVVTGLIHDYDPPPPLSPRTIDAFIEKAFEHGNKISPRWIALFLSLGIAATSDAVEIHFLSFIMVDGGFRRSILLEDDDHQGGGGGGGGEGTMAASIFLGMMIGGIASGILSDYSLGRRGSLQLGLILNGLAGLCTAASPNLTVLTLTRTLGGFGIGATIPPLFVLATEFAPQSKRGLYVTIVASFFMVGSVFVAAVAWILLGTFHVDWRIFAVVCSFPCLVGVCLVWALVPESPRYLALRRRYDAAAEVTNRVASWLEPEYIYCNLEGEGGFEELTVEEIKRQFPPTNNVTSRTPGSASFGDRMRKSLNQVLSLYVAPETRRTLLPLQLIWFALCFASYGLITWINSIFEVIHLSDPFLNRFLFAAAYFPGNVASWLLTDRAGRKRLLSASLLLSAAFLLLFAFGAAGEDPNRYYGLVVLSACSYQACVCVAWNTLETLTGEDFCTAVRSTAFGVCAASGRVGAIVAQFVDSDLIGRPGALLAVSSGCLLVGAVAPWTARMEDLTNRALQDKISGGSGSGTGEDGRYGG